MLDKSIIAERRAQLDTIRAQLRTEFFGLDDIIDRVIESVSAWYIFPQLITRPVIVNLWGMTGVGKTQLVRRLSALLGFGDKFVEVVMDGSSKHGYFGSSSLSSILNNSKIEEGQPGILLLDEMQRFRTIDDAGNEVKVERYQDVWTLLSDGKFSSDSTVFAEIEMMLAYRENSVRKIEEPSTDDDKAEEDKKKKEEPFRITPWQAREFKKTLRLAESIREIMSWDEVKLASVLENALGRESWEIDYTKLVIFISGNLDSAFKGAMAAGDSDSDADFYHQLTRNISVNTIKDHLMSRFKPEQVARFGNNHIIYPSLSRKSYEALIARSVNQYVREMEKVSGIKFAADQSLLDRIYANSVYPTQGTRPVFSSIHKMFSTLLVDAAFWAIENDVRGAEFVMTKELSNGEHKVQAIQTLPRPRSKKTTKTALFHVEFDMDKEKKKRSVEFTAMVAAHEAGHALVYALLKRVAPFELKVNVASFKGGYMMPVVEGEDIMSKQNVLDEICVLLAGRAAEELVFGQTFSSSGAASDIGKATQLAGQYTRHWGFDGNIARVDKHVTGYAPYSVNAYDESDERIAAILAEQLVRAKTTIQENRLGPSG
jgi:hypothetical protein